MWGLHGCDRADWRTGGSNTVGILADVTHVEGNEIVTREAPSSQPAPDATTMVTTALSTPTPSSQAPALGQHGTAKASWTAVAVHGKVLEFVSKPFPTEVGQELQRTSDVCLATILVRMKERVETDVTSANLVLPADIAAAWRPTGSVDLDTGGERIRQVTPDRAEMLRVATTPTQIKLV